MRTAHGNKYYFLFFHAFPFPAAYLPERYHHCHCPPCRSTPWAHFLSAVWAAFLGDFFFYPSPCSSPLPPTVSAPSSCPLSWQVWKRQLPCRSWRDHPRRLIAIAGYTLGKAYVYSTWEYAMLKLPFEILQAFIGSAIGLFLWKNRKWGKTIRRFLGY